jgi:TfoX/Sxy family transcriptional regulator of competence genes
MAYDTQLADRVRSALTGVPDLSERTMFGGLAFLMAGHMVCGVVGADLMLRLGELEADDALDRPHVRPMDFTGRPMRSMVYVAPAGVATPAELQQWLDRALRFVGELPPKRSR